MKGILLHGGTGTRLRPLTHTGPKQLIRIANKPMSQYALEAMVDAGIKDIAIILGDINPGMVKEYYGDGSRFNCSITYIEQGKPLGIAHAIGLAEEFVGNEKFVVYLGDNLLESSIYIYTEQFEKNELDAFLLFTKSEHPEHFGVARLSADGKLAELVEKPKNPPSNLIITGIYYFTPKLFRYIKKLKPSWRNELEITEAIQHMLEDNLRIDYKLVDGWWKDTGTPEDIITANQLVLDKMVANNGKSEHRSNFQGRVVAGNNLQCGENVLIRGPVIIGNDVNIGSNTYIGPYTSIGDRVVIAGGEIENSIIMDDSVIKIQSRIVDSIIGNGSIVRENHSLPKGHKMVLGTNTQVILGE